jgi:hypothetical protein
VLGGITYAEVQVVNDFNNQKNGVRVIIGGTTIHNTSSFIRDVQYL